MNTRHERDGRTSPSRGTKRGGGRSAATEDDASLSNPKFAAKRACTTNSPETIHDQSADTFVSEEEHKGSHPRKWSDEEDERLRASVEKHQGTHWREVANDVKSRTHEQCLQRWKKVLAPGLIKGQWTPEEDQLLLSVVNEGQEHKNWGTVSERIPGRTSKQCRERWSQHLDPRIVKSRWTAAEDGILVSMQKRIGNKWAQIARHLEGRTENAVKIRWKILEREMKKNTERDDQKEKSTDTDLRGLAAQAAATLLSKASSPKGPNEVSMGPAAAYGGHVDGKSSDGTMGLQDDDIDVHIQNEQPSPSAVGPRKGAMSGGKRQGQDSHIAGRGGWLADEDERLKQAVQEFGERNWREVARVVRTRNQVQCTQRWKKALRPGLVKGPWRAEEDEGLIALMAQGFSSWGELAANTRRTAKQCRERWTHHLDPNLRHGSWTPEENELLITLEARLGTKWAAIAREIPGRTEHAVKGRFKTLLMERDMDRQAGLQQRRSGKGPPVGRQPATPNVRPQELAMNPNIGAQHPTSTTTTVITTPTALLPPLVPMPAAASNTNTNMNKPVVDANCGGEASEESIARLLSVSSVKTDTTLPDITSGYCGRGRSSATSTSTTIRTRSSSISDMSSKARTQSDAEPRRRVAEAGAGERPPVLPVHELSPRVSDGLPPSEDLSLVDEIDYSDLVSVLMDEGVNPSKDGALSGVDEAVTLGRDAYGDYALSADNIILIGHGPDVLSKKPRGSEPPPTTEQDEGVHGQTVEDVGVTLADWIDVLPTSFFERGVADEEPADPFYF